jgi:RNA polymerase sigma-70 factor (ECF subfamily)
MMGDSDAALVSAAQQGQPAAFEELVRRTSRLIYAQLFLDTGDVHLSEDLLQETLLRAHRSLGQLHDRNGVRRWLLTIARNVLTDSARREARQKRAEPPRSDQPLTRVPAAAPPPDALLQREEERRQVLAILRSLPEEYRLPLTLRYIAGADYETISTQLGLTNGSLRGLLHRGLKMLRERLPPELGND